MPIANQNAPLIYFILKVALIVYRHKNRGRAVFAEFLPTGCKSYDKTDQKRISEIRKINR
jgi:hypothetical protein